MTEFIEPNGSPFDKIDAQNDFFIRNFDNRDFDRSTQMDPTLNFAQCYIHAALEEIAKYPQGQFPSEIAQSSIESTLRLLLLCEKEYPAEAVKPLSQAFHSNWNLWYGDKLALCHPDLFVKRLFQSGDELQRAIRTFNVYVAAHPQIELRKVTSIHSRNVRNNGLKGPKTGFMEEQRYILKLWISQHPDALRGCKTCQKAAKLCWLEHKAEWDAAAKSKGDNRGYKTPKALAAGVGA